MQPLNLKPTHKLVKNYYQALGQFGQLNIGHEMAGRDAFRNRNDGFLGARNYARTANDASPACGTEQLSPALQRWVAWK